ncbi:hypothetical protein JCM5296_003957 [Sporobolomyces johnsonii]
MPRSRTHQHRSLSNYSDDSDSSRLDASPPSTFRSSPPRLPRPPPRGSVSSPPRFDVPDTAYLSADDATRLMLEKWDAMDELAVREQERQEGDESSNPPEPRRGGRRARAARACSMPTPRPDQQSRTRRSRVSEYEMWEPERERIRLAQVEMERQLEAEASQAAREIVETEEKVQCDHTLGVTIKVKDRKATPGFVVVEGSNCDLDEWRSSGCESVATSLASTSGSTPPPVDDDVGTERARSDWHEPTVPARPVRAAVHPPLPRGPSLPLPHAANPNVHPPRSPGELPSPLQDADVDQHQGTGSILGATATAGLAAAEHLGEAVTSALSKVFMPSFFTGRMYP